MHRLRDVAQSAAGGAEPVRQMAELVGAPFDGIADGSGHGWTLPNEDRSNHSNEDSVIQPARRGPGGDPGPGAAARQRALARAVTADRQRSSRIPPGSRPWRGGAAPFPSAWGA